MSTNIGYRDQEILIGAITTYVTSKLDKSQGIIKGMIRICIQEYYEQTQKTIRDLKGLPEKERDDFFLHITEVFFKKLRVELALRRKMKYDFLQIYERWKESKRQELEEVDPLKAQQLQQDEDAQNNEEEVQEDALFDSNMLIEELDDLDFDDL